MRITANKKCAGVLAIGLIVGALTGVSATAVGADSAKQARDATYLQQVINVMRAHVLSMRMILEHDDLKYADNMVRHAEAFERAFGMVGPMEWHAAEAFQYMQRSDAADKLTQEQFEALAEASYKTIVDVTRSARRYERDKNEQLMRASINTMITSCGACHSKMPKGTVPSVWKGMKE